MPDNPLPKSPSAEDFFSRVDSAGPASPSENLSSEPTTNIPGNDSGTAVIPPFVPTGGGNYSPPPPAPTESLIFSDPIPAESGIKKKIILLAGGLLVIILVLFLIKTILSKGKNISREVTLNYWGLWEPNDVFSSVISDFQKTHPKIKINYSMQSARDYRERLQSALNSGSGPDLFRFHNTWLPMLRVELAPIPTTVMDGGTFERTFYPVVKNDLRSGEAYYGIPLGIDSLGLYYNEEIFTSAGKTPPKTWDEFRQLASQLTVKEAGGKIQTAGAAMGLTVNIDHWSDVLGLLLFQNGADPANPTNNLADDSLLFYTIFSRQDRVWDSSLPNSTYYFSAGKLAMYFAPSWRVFDLKAANPNLKFKIVPVPQLPGANFSWATYWVEGVAKKSIHQAEAWEFLKYLSQKETLQKMYQLTSNKRLFGEPYPRVDMAESLKNQPLVGVFVEQMPVAKSWYLSSRTFDNGINDKIIKYYEDAVNAVNKGTDPKSALVTVANGVKQILSQYGVVGTPTK